MKTRVLVIDASPPMRAALMRMIQLSPDMDVVGAAQDSASGMEMVKALKPDVLVLSADLSRTDDFEYLEQLTTFRSIPLVLVSGRSDVGADVVLPATLLNNAVAGGRAAEASAEELVDKIRAVRFSREAKGLSPESATAAGPSAVTPSLTGSGKIIFVGASTGGTEALKVFLSGMPADCPPVLVVQHMPETFTGSFARRLDSLCPPRVIEARGGERVQAGTVYLAPGHSHLRIRRATSAFETELLQTLAVNRHRPSVDVLFESAAELVGRQAIGVILTGMGKDGAQGLLRMRHAGAKTYGQDESSCVVYGMPREAYVIGAVEEQVPLDDMAKRVLIGLGRAVRA